MKGVYGNANDHGNLAGSVEKKCPNCGTPRGPKVLCQSCGRQGCANCIGMEKPSGCKECGSGPVIYIY